jgi:Predicted integral membrane protein
MIVITITYKEVFYLKFNIESPIFQFLTTLSQFILLNVIFLICCLPVVTVGASVTALYYVTMQEARADYGYIIRNYLKSWKNNFKQATIVWLLYLVIGSILLFNLRFWQALHSTQGTVIFVLLTLVTALFCISLLYVFPLLARFHNSTILTIQNSIFIALQNWKKTFLLIALHGLYIFLCLLVPEAKIFMVLLGFAFFAYCNSFLLVRVFKKYEPASEVAVEESRG